MFFNAEFTFTSLVSCMGKTHKPLYNWKSQTINKMFLNNLLGGETRGLGPVHPRAKYAQKSLHHSAMLHDPVLICEYVD